MESRNIIGLMSGTSLDGLDIAFCSFEHDGNRWSYNVIQAETLAYSEEWKNRLSSAYHSTAAELAQLHADYGHYLGKATASFIQKHRLEPGLISSHGHTVFHDPSRGVTFQAGSGAAIAAECRLPVVCDLRSLDVALGGQGAPLVPVGDKLLFGEYDYCLNLGGFANISYDRDRRRIAYDIVPVNIVANAICEKLGKMYDYKGETGRQGTIDKDLLDDLNAIPFYHKPPHTPKSLGKEWIDSELMPVMKKHSLAPAIQLRTLYEHIAIQVGKAIRDKNGKMLITGGGAYNTFLIERIKHHAKVEITETGKDIIEFKEALIFAFLGLLRVEGKVNALGDVTGAGCDSISGCVYLPPPP
jgi:anhydro-N-acetylmuramic acid kinase